MAKNKSVRKPPAAKGQFIKTPELVQKSSDSEYIMFSFHHQGNDRCVNSCEMNEKAALSERLYHLSRQTWGQIRQVPKQVGFEPVDRDLIKVSPPRSVTPDVDQYLICRFNNEEGRLIGYRADAIFHIIWIDRNRSMYKH